MKALIKKIIPRSILNLRHLVYAYWGAIRFRHPSRELYVIGVTGTSGKSTTTLLLRHILEAAGYTVGSLSTVDFYIAGKEQLNDQKMTMLGKAKIQEYLRKMVDHGCEVAIVEVTSEGAMQHRHRCINFDMAVMTNLYPEHIEHHGSFEKYKGWKLHIFKTIANCKHKYKLSEYNTIALCNEKTCTDPFEKVLKVGIANANNEHIVDFLQYGFDQKFIYGFADQPWSKVDARTNEIKAANLDITQDGMSLSVNGHQIEAPLYGAHNAMNLITAVTCAHAMGVAWDVIARGTASLPAIPGRIEQIEEAKAHGFTAIVDYAFEPVALGNLYQVVDLFKPKRVIHVLGGTGGGRDTARREPIGKIAGERADIVIVTDEDPYDEDPLQIMEMVAKGAEKAGKIREESLFIIPERQEAINKAVSIAKKGDMVLVTGKGSEQAMCLANGKKIPWDDRDAIRKGLSALA